MRMQDFQTQQKPHVNEMQHNADEALLVYSTLISWCLD